MSEIAINGGCITVDTRNPQEITNAITENKADRLHMIFTVCL